MAQPTPYSRLKNFTQYATDHTSAPYNASDHDVELDAIETTLDDLCANLALIQRDDGYLKNASVHADAFSTAALALIASDWTPRGLWVTATAYAVGDVVEASSVSYVCATVHTSGVFATDHAAGKWIVLGQAAGTAASGITASAYSHIAATNVQAFLEELTDEKARLAGSTSQTFDVADASDDTHAVAAGQIQKDSLCTATAGGTSDALTATIASGLTTLTDKMRVRVKATAANGTTGPTFNLTLGSTSTSAKTIKKGNAQALVIGDVAGSGHMLELVYSSSDDCWLLQNPAYPVGQSTAAIDADSIRNIGIAFSTGASALTASLKSATGGTPSASDAVQAAMRSSSASTGTYATRSVTSSLTLTAPSGATLGHASGAPSVTHWYLLDNAGTQELAASSRYYGKSGIVSTDAIGAGSTSSKTMYSTSARSGVAFRWIAATIDTQATAGTWVSNPVLVSLVENDWAAIDKLRAGEIWNGKISTSVAASALTISVKTRADADPSINDLVFVGVPSATLTDSGVTVIAITAAVTLTVPSGATLGHADALACHLFPYIINNVGIAELAVSNLPPDYPGTFANTRLISTTAIGTGSDSATGIYSTNVRTSVPWICVAMCKSTQTTAGTWAANMTQVDQAPFVAPTCFFRASGTNSQLFADATFVKQTMNNESYDPDGVYDAATNYRYQPNVAGFYKLHGGLGGNYVVSAYLITAFFQNGSEVTRCQITTAPGFQMVEHEDIIFFNGTTDYVECYGYQNSGGSMNLDNSYATFHGIRLTGGY